MQRNPNHYLKTLKDSELNQAMELKVSRNPVRETLIRMQKDALVEIIPDLRVHRSFMKTFIRHKNGKR